MYDIPNAVRRVADSIDRAGGRPFLVGGTVRDLVLRGAAPRDWDIEVFGIGIPELKTALASCRVQSVGEAFGVLKVFSDGVDIDVSVPRFDNRVGVGHCGFVTDFNPDMTMSDAARRRDFTINAMFLDFTGNVVDPFDGEVDWKNRVLRKVSSAFSEDPLRVLRAMQFSARFNMGVDDSTTAMCRSLVSEYDTLSVERVWAEWRKWALSDHPGVGLDMLVKMGWVELYPEIQALIGLPQDGVYHPEGDVFAHTRHAVEYAAHIAERDGLNCFAREVLVFAALTHDFGKDACTEIVGERVTSRGHASIGAEMAPKFLRSIGAPDSIAEYVVPLVKEHMCRGYSTELRLIRRLADRLRPATIDDWCRIKEVDISSRPPKPAGLPEEYVNVRRLAAEMGVADSAPKPVLLGRHLLAGNVVSPGPEMGRILREAYEAQLDGVFDSPESGVMWVRSLVDAGH